MFERIMYFLAVAAHLNFTRAADECHITQTAMSRQIRKLEEDLGVVLFFRNNRLVELTPAGTVFLEEAKHLLHQLQAATELTRSVAAGKGGILRIGFGPHEKFLLTEPVSRFKSLYPKAHVICEMHSYRGLITNLMNGSLDIIFSLKGCPGRIPGCISKMLCQEDWLAVANKNHPLACKDFLTEEDLRGLDVACHCDADGTCSPEKTYEFFRQSGFEPRSIIPANSLEAKLLEVESGCTITLLPEPMIPELVDRFHVFRFKDISWAPPSFYVTHMPGNYNHLLKFFYDVAIV